MCMFDCICVRRLLDFIYAVPTDLEFILMLQVNLVTAYYQRGMYADSFRLIHEHLHIIDRVSQSVRQSVL